MERIKGIKPRLITIRRSARQRKMQRCLRSRFCRRLKALSTHSLKDQLLKRSILKKRIWYLCALILTSTLIGYLRNHNLDETMDSTIVRIYGINSKGNSIVAHIYNFRPYFYMQCAFNQIIE